MFLASPVLAQSPVLVEAGFTETVLNETGQVNATVVDGIGFGPNEHGYRITSVFLANTGKARLVQLNGGARYRYGDQVIVGRNSTGLIHHSLTAGSGIFWTATDYSPGYHTGTSEQWDDDGDRPFHKSSMAGASWLATQDILMISSLENPTIVSGEDPRPVYCDDYPHIYQTDQWIPPCGALDDYIAYSGVAIDRTIFVGALRGETAALSAVRDGGVFEQNAIYVESPDGSTSQATPVLAAYATNLAAANPTWDAAKLKQELMALATDETLLHYAGAQPETRVVKVIRSSIAPGGGGELQIAAVVVNQTFTVGAAIPALVLPGPSGGLPPYTYSLAPAPPTGLVFDENIRTISGVPVEVSAATTYTFSAVDYSGSSVSLTFTIEVAGSVSFEEVVADQFYSHTHPIAPLALPEAAGGVPPIVYTLTPTLPAGLSFDASMRTISGTPTEVTAAPVPQTYKATDANGSADSLQFSIEVAGAVSFADVVADQSYSRTHPIAPLALPEAAGGVPPIVYTLTPTLPAGLSFDASTRTISGTPTEVTAAPVPYTYKATDANGSADSLQFTIEVYSPVAVEHETVPESFVVRGNYPNPFRQSTHLVFDLPWPARVRVEVLDVTGRRVLTVPTRSLAAGWERSIELSGASLSPGLYLYRVIATSPEGSSTHVGRVVRIR